MLQGGVRLDGRPLGAEQLELKITEADGAVLQAGKRRFVRLQISGDV